MERLVHGLSIILLSGLLIASGARADVVIGGKRRQFTRDTLLARSDVASIDVAHDVSYGKAMGYRAVPMATLLAGLSLPGDSVIEAGRRRRIRSATASRPGHEHGPR
jgi:hypothetical protein